jgi:hypothetical protein
MAAEAPGMIVNGGPIIPSKSAAALLEEQHARHETFRATVEDVPDEDDLPASQSAPAKDMVSNAPKDSFGDAALDGEAVYTTSTPKTGPKNAPTFDVRSEESFPALGSTPKSKIPAAMPMAWGVSKKPATTSSLTNGLPNGVQSSRMSLIHTSWCVG